MVPLELSFKDTTAYFGVYFNKPSWWFARLVLEAREPWVGFNVPEDTFRAALPDGMRILASHPYADWRVAISDVSDLVRLEPMFVAAMNQCIESRED
jgi:hypothetical protein